MSASTEPPTNLIASSAQDIEGLLSLGLYALIATGLILILLLLARFLGQRTHSEAKDAPYESAVDPTGDARLREPVPFYLVAIFFIVFDVEAVFVVSWAVAYDLLGWAGFWQISFFIFILFLGLVYLWKMGGLEWGSQSARDQKRRIG
ncbi:MAG: NADH-quinone oxidoreductase subunit A [Deltaproteobacteria bacterium]|nr:NADH-quinone oxidoreductase subunit A [Deltaproteobacteria bacterium]MCW8893582.1 NADH-quinone oxidoreductase subunit A [Deltaproteobacteria bacterium]MCW9049966.1 NADH-quinone oxidoreductase subunit A [Deltaproteobacteria bacterium]